MGIKFDRHVTALTIIPDMIDTSHENAMAFASLFRELLMPHLDEHPREIIVRMTTSDKPIYGMQSEYIISVAKSKPEPERRFPPIPDVHIGPLPVPQPQTAPVEELDARGECWNPELHAASKGKNQDGTWRKKRIVKSNYKKHLLEQSGLITVEETCSMMGVRHHMQLTRIRYENPLFPMPQYIEGYAGYKREDILSYIELTKDEDSPPRFKCETDEYGCWYFECPHCHDRHTHGAGAGHRSAHCDVLSGSPFLESGYYITQE